MTAGTLPPDPVVPQGPSQVDQAKVKARAKAQEVSGQALATGRTQVQQRAVQLGGLIESAAQDVRAVGTELLKSGKETPAKVVVQAADQADKVSRFMKQVDADQLTGYAKKVNPAGALHAVEDFGRKRPLPVLGSSLALGYVVSRLIKASSAKRYAGSEGNQPVGSDGQFGTPVAGEAAFAPSPGTAAPNTPPAVTPPAVTPPAVKPSSTAGVRETPVRFTPPSSTPRRTS